MAISGVASSLDIQQLVQQMMAQDQESIDLLQSQKQSYTQQKIDLASISNSLSFLKSSLLSLKDPSKFYSLQAASSDSNIATAVASSDASITNYVLSDITLAQAAQKQGAALLIKTTYSYRQSLSDISDPEVSVDPNQALSSDASNIADHELIHTGNFNINGVNIAIDVDVDPPGHVSDTLYQVLGKINSSGAGVTATYAEDRITLTANTKGAKEIVLGDDTSGFLAVMKVTELTTGLDDLNQKLVSVSDRYRRWATLAKDFLISIT